MSFKRATSLAAFLVMIALPACNTEEDEPPVATGEQSGFDIAGDVTAVDIEDVDFDVSIPPDGVEVDVDAGITVDLTVNVETIDEATSQLCVVEAGQDVVLTVTEETDLDFDRPLSELGTLEDESIRATGTARQSAAVQSPDENAADPAGNCELQAATLSVVEEQSPASPAATISPTPSPLN